jgi:hypothetical protein
MKKRIYFITTALAAFSVLSLSSCLKDPRYVNFGQGGTVVNFPTGGLSKFGADAITESTDTVVRQIAVEVASPTVPSTPTKVTLAVDNSIIAAYAKTNSAVSYNTFPDGTYALSATEVTIPAGKRSAVVSVTIYKGLLDPSQSYMLPVKIATANSGYIISGNMGIHYFHIIGNDFAGTYVWDYRRWQNTVGPASGPPNGPGSFEGEVDGTTTTIFPVTPTEFQVETGYNGTGVNYDVTFTKTGTGATATYTNWSVQFLPGDIQKWTDAGITNFVAPAFTIPPPATGADPKKFEFHYTSGGSAANGRYIDDTYIKQ